MASEAEKLRRTARRHREWSEDRVAELKATIEGLEDRVGAMEASNVELARENRNLVTEVKGLNRTISDLREEIRDLIRRLRKSHQRVVQLEEEQ